MQTETETETVTRIRWTLLGKVKFTCDPYTTWSDEYGRRANVYVTPSGEVYVDVHTDDNHCQFPVWKFANLESFNAHRREVEYVDREHRFPGVNPHRRVWQYISPFPA